MRSKRSDLVIDFLWVLTLTACQSAPAPSIDATSETRGDLPTIGRSIPSAEARSSPDYEVVNAQSGVLAGRISQVIVDLARENGAATAAELKALVKEFEALADSDSDRSDPIAESCEVVLGELRILIEFLTGESLILQRSTGYVLEFSPVHISGIASALEEYGLVLHGPHLELAVTGGQRASAGDWKSAQRNRITSGRWAGAFATDDGGILLPGLASLRAESAARQRGSSDESGSAASSKAKRNIKEHLPSPNSIVPSRCAIAVR